MRRIHVLLVLCTLLAGCGPAVFTGLQTMGGGVSSFSAPSAPPIQSAEIITPAPIETIRGYGELEVRVQKIIEPRTAGSLSGDWTEVQLTIKNRSGENISIERVRALDQSGVYRDQIGSADVMRIAFKPVYDRAKQSEASLNPVNQITSSLAGTVLGSFIPGGNLLFAGYKMVQQGGQYGAETMEREKANLLIEEFRKRQIARATLAPDGSITGSVFFAPGEMRELGIIYSGNKEMGIRLDGTDDHRENDDDEEIAEKPRHVGRVRTANGYKVVLK